MFQQALETLRGISYHCSYHIALLHKYNFMLSHLLYDCDRQNNGPPKMSTPSSLEPVNILCGKGELRLQVELRLLMNGLRDKEVTLDYPGEAYVITRVLTSEGGRKESRHQRDMM